MYHKYRCFFKESTESRISSSRVNPEVNSLERQETHDSPNLHSKKHKIESTNSADSVYEEILSEIGAEEEIISEPAELDDEQELQIIGRSARLDTVGAVAVDLHGRVAAGVSSGGIVLKNAGRVGQAAMYGSGCWAENQVGVSTSGVGEQLIRCLLAERCARRLIDSVQELEAEEQGQLPVEAVRDSMLKDFMGMHGKKKENKVLFSYL